MKFSVADIFEINIKTSICMHAVMTSMVCGMDERAMLGASVFHIMALRQWSWILLTSNLQARLRVGPV
jgi:hypothetical protein